MSQLKRYDPRTPTEKADQQTLRSEILKDTYRPSLETHEDLSREIVRLTKIVRALNNKIKHN